MRLWIAPLQVARGKEARPQPPTPGNPFGNGRATVGRQIEQLEMHIFEAFEAQISHTLSKLVFCHMVLSFIGILFGQMYKLGSIGWHIGMGALKGVEIFRTWQNRASQGGSNHPGGGGLPGIVGDAILPNNTICTDPGWGGHFHNQSFLENQAVLPGGRPHGDQREIDHKCEKRNGVKGFFLALGVCRCLPSPPQWAVALKKKLIALHMMQIRNFASSHFSQVKYFVVQQPFM